MGGPRWPSQQPDGTVVVAVRLAVAGLDTLGLVEHCISHWIAKKESAGVRLERDLASSPTAEPVGPGRIDVVINGTAESQKWKDWMVDLTHQLSAIGGVQVAGFEDRVSGAFRPIHPG